MEYDRLEDKSKLSDTELRERLRALTSQLTEKECREIVEEKRHRIATSLCSSQ